MSVSEEYQIASNHVYHWSSSDAISENTFSKDSLVATDSDHSQPGRIASAGPSSTSNLDRHLSFAVLPPRHPLPSYPLTIDPLTRFVTTLARRRVKVIGHDEFRMASGEARRDGATMTVRRATWSAQEMEQIVAVKTLKTGPQREFFALLQDMLFEIQVMAHMPLCNHRNMMNLIGVAFGEAEAMGEAEHHFRPMLLVPWADRGTVADLCRQPSLPFLDAATIAADVADGLEALHLYGIVHGDIKPENVLLFTDTTSITGVVAKLSDFGFCTSEQDQIELVRGGTLRWAAPEACQTHRPCLTQRSDVFSFGQLAIFVALEGNWVPWDNNEETIPELCLRTERSLYEAHEAVLNGNTDHVSRWLEILWQTMIEDPAERLPSHRLGAVRAQLLGVDVYANEKERHFRNVIPFRGTKGWLNSQERVKAASSPTSLWMLEYVRSLPENVRSVLRRDWDQIDTKNLAHRGLHPASAMSMQDLCELSVVGPAIDYLENREGSLRRYPVAVGRGFLTSILFNNDDEGIPALRNHVGTMAKLVFGNLYGTMLPLFQRVCSKRSYYRDETLDSGNGDMPRLWQTAFAGDLDTVASMLHDDPRTLRTVYHGGTLVHAAAEYDDVLLLKVLLSENQLAVNWFNSVGQTPLHIAAALTNVRTVELLLGNSGIDILANKEAVGTPLRWALIQYSLLSLWGGSSAAVSRCKEIIYRLQRRIPCEEESKDWPAVVKILSEVVTQVFRMAIGSACQAAMACYFISRIYRLWPLNSWKSTLSFLTKTVLGLLGLQTSKSLITDVHTETFGLIAICAVDLLCSLQLMDSFFLLLYFVSCVLHERSLADMVFLKEDLARQWEAMGMEGHLDLSQNYITIQMYGLISKILGDFCSRWRSYHVKQVKRA